MESAVVRIKKGEGRSLKAGGMWIYDNEIDTIKGDYANGDMVFVEDFDGYPLGHGFINTNSKLTVRMMSRKKDTVVDDDFLEMRVRAAWEYRKTTTDTSSCRLIFGEADFLPGIVIDKFSDVLVVESLAWESTGSSRLSWTSLRRSWPRTESRSAASTNEVMPRSGSRKAWSASRASSAIPSTPRWRSWKITCIIS